MAILCLTFDNMGSALAVGARQQGRPGPDDVGPLGYPEVMDLLAELDLKATFFIEGWNALHNPAAIHRLVEQGHDVATHGWAHEAVGSLEQPDLARVVHDATAAFRAIGVTPVGFRAPGGKRGRFLHDELAELGYRYDSSIDHGPADAEDLALEDRPYDRGSLRVIPWRWRNIDYYHYAMHPDGPKSAQQVERHFISELDHVVETDGVATFIFHAFVSCIASDRRAALTSILRRAIDDPRIEILNAAQLAERPLN